MGLLSGALAIIAGLIVLVIIVAIAIFLIKLLAPLIGGIIILVIIIAGIGWLVSRSRS